MKLDGEKKDARPARVYFGDLITSWVATPVHLKRVFFFSYFGFGALTLLVVLERTETNVLDREVARWLHGHSELRNSFVEFLTVWGDVGRIGILTWSLAIVLLVLGRWRFLPGLFFAVFGGINLTVFLQDIVGRARPHFEGIFITSRPGYPSGHAAAATLFYGFLLLIILSELKNRIGKKIFFIFLLSVVLLIGATRIILLAHYFSDVIGGILGAVAWLLLCWLLNDFLSKRFHCSRLLSAGRSKPGILRDKDSVVK